MDLLLTYDVATDTPEGRRRLRHVAKICLDFGQRVQKSVFECSLSDTQYVLLKDRLLQCIDQQSDSLRIYRLPEGREGWIEHYGLDQSIDFDGPLVV
jgi:CRISPR-associated protein Cas2